MKKEVDSFIFNANTVGLQCDGWSNVKTDGIVNFVVTTPKPVFYKSTPTATNSESGQYIADQLSRIIDEIGASKVLALCTDNASAMKLAWKILDAKYSQSKILFYGYVSHILKLLMTDIANLPSRKSLVQSATSTVNEISRGHVVKAVFTEIQKKTQEHQPKDVKESR